MRLRKKNTHRQVGYHPDPRSKKRTMREEKGGDPRGQTPTPPDNQKHQRVPSAIAHPILLTSHTHHPLPPSIWFLCTHCPRANRAVELAGQKDHRKGQKGGLWREGQTKQGQWAAGEETQRQWLWCQGEGGENPTLAHTLSLSHILKYWGKKVKPQPQQTHPPQISRGQAHYTPSC